MERRGFFKEAAAALTGMKTLRGLEPGAQTNKT